MDICDFLITAKVCVCGLTAPPARWDGGTVVFDVQSAGSVEDGVNEDVCLTLLQNIQHLLQMEKKRKER